jgi:hypothetical protein
MDRHDAFVRGVIASQPARSSCKFGIDVDEYRTRAESDTPHGREEREGVVITSSPALTSSAIKRSSSASDRSATDCVLSGILGDEFRAPHFVAEDERCDS